MCRPAPKAASLRPERSSGDHAAGVRIETLNGYPAKQAIAADMSSRRSRNWDGGLVVSFGTAHSAVLGASKLFKLFKLSASELQ
jgi:hypothetical protein